MAGTLHVIATPIGNLEDISIRAVRLLGSVALIAAEDTRRSAKLLGHFGIATRTISYHEHNSRSRTPTILARLRAGEDVALITDAGTPAVSDPGIELIQACIREQISVNPVPGASAPLTAVVASGFPALPLTILGFAPARANDRTSWLSGISAIEHTMSFFESPTRILATLDDMATVFGERPICVARELTKAHQELLRGNSASVRQQLTAARGEFTVIVGPAVPAAAEPVAVSDAELLAELGRMTKPGISTRRMAVAELARTYNRSTRDVYAAIERAKQAGD